MTLRPCYSLIITRMRVPRILTSSPPDHRSALGAHRHRWDFTDIGGKSPTSVAHLSVGYRLESTRFDALTGRVVARRTEAVASAHPACGGIHVGRVASVRSACHGPEFALNRSLVKRVRLHPLGSSPSTTRFTWFRSGAVVFYHAKPPRDAGAPTARVPMH